MDTKYILVKHHQIAILIIGVFTSKTGPGRCHTQLNMFRAISNLTESEAQ